RGVPRVDPDTDLREPAKRRSTASRLRHAQAPRGENHTRSSEALRTRRPPPLSRRSLQRSGSPPEVEPYTRIPGSADQCVTHIPRAVREGKELPRLLLQPQRHTEVRLEERALLPQRPGEKHLPQTVARRIGDVPGRRQLAREHVASTPTADQDLPPPVRGALHQVDHPS